MKCLYLTLSFLFLYVDHVSALSVRDVKVSVSADSAAAAREQALEKAHALAFEKLVSENFPEKEGSLPSPDTLMNMVTNFSIDKEKTTPKSYAASLTFQFDEAQVQRWLQKAESKPVHSGLTLTSPVEQADSFSTPSSSQRPSNIAAPFKVTASYTSLPEWQNIKKSLEQAQGMVKVNVMTLSSQKATLNIQFGGDMTRLEQHLLSQGLSLTPHGNGNEWVITSIRAIR